MSKATERPAAAVAQDLLVALVGLLRVAEAGELRIVQDGRGSPVRRARG
jgi:hypothetical protein